MKFWEILPWFISGITLTSMWMAGNKSPNAWLLGLFNQILWCSLMVHAHLWGLLPTSIGIVIIYTRNLIKWRADEREKRQFIAVGLRLDGSER